jgi:hypothetical protein
MVYVDLASTHLILTNTEPQHTTDRRAKTLKDHDEYDLLLLW